MAVIYHSREVYLANHHIKSAMYAAAIFDHLPPELRESLPEDAKARIEEGLSLHDISKTIENGWTDHLLFSERHPFPWEWQQVIIPHPEKAEATLRRAGIEDAIVLAIARKHHMRFDGAVFEGVDCDGSTIPKYAGYPERKEGEGHEIYGQIAKVADAASSMEEDRPYRVKRFTPRKIREDVEERSGTEYSPVVVEAYCRIPLTILNEIFHHRLRSPLAARNIEKRLELIKKAAKAGRNSGQD